MPDSGAAPTRVAVIGVGRLGSIHARVLHELDEAELVAVVDIDADRARSIADDRGCEVRALDDLGDVEAAVVATPTTTHHEIASDLIDRGISVLVEKPIAADADEAEDLCRRAEEQGVTLMVGHSERFNPVIRALEERDFEPRFMELQRVSPFSFRGADVGVVLDLMIHDIDIVLHLVKSAPKSIDAVGVPVIGTTEDLANARIVFENGAVANVTASRVALKTERVLRVFGGDFYASLDLAQKSGRIIRKGPALDSGMLDLETAMKEGLQNPLAFMQQGLVRMEDLRADDTEALVAENRAFLEAHRRKTPPPVTGRDGLVALDCALRITESVRRFHSE